MRRVSSRKINNKKKLITVFSIMIILSIGFFVGYKIAEYQNPTVKADIIASDEIMNDREEKTDQVISQEVDEQMEVMNVYKPDGNKIAYLTFDDGPSNVTPKILDILKKNNIHASFFVIGNLAEARSDLIKREVQEGNKVYNHTYTHVYKDLYSSPQSFIDNVNKCNETLKNILGASYNSKIIRFPGGSFGSNLAPYRDAISKAGYSYIDWNSLSGDSESKSLPPDKLVARLKQTAKSQHLVILMHDASGKDTTAQALQSIIDYLISNGYTFKTL